MFGIMSNLSSIDKTEGKILIIEDIKNHQELYFWILEKLCPNIKLFKADSGKLGLEIVNSKMPDIIFIDIILPDMTGFNICKLLKANEDTQNIPIIMFSHGDLNTKTKQQIMESGADGYINKPFDRLDLLTQINSMMRIKRAEDQLGIERNQLRKLINIKNQELMEEKEKHKKSEESLKKSLKEKEILLKEIHHRVKNNLAMVSSLLNIQSGYIKDKMAKSSFHECQRRINSIALIHEKLYQSSDLQRIEFKQYIFELTQTIVKSYSIPDEMVEIVFDISDIYLNISHSIPLGLIVTELVTNSLKYGFKNNQILNISINLKCDKKNYYLEVSDNGIGIPEEFDWENTDTLGFQLVILLTQQLEGKIFLNRDQGTSFRINFPNRN